MLGEAKTEFSDAVPSGTVISVDPPQGTEVLPESTVTLTVSKGRAPVQVPDVSKGTFDQAKATLEAAGFTVTQGPDQFSDTVESGQVIGTNPDIGDTVPYGAPVEVIVSKGPDLVMVPSFIGDFLGTALAQLDSLGFLVDLKGPQQLSKRVQDQSPAGAPAPRGSTVSLGT